MKRQSQQLRTVIVNDRQKMKPNDNLLIYPMPSLVATLLNRENAKGAPLTEDEVIAIRNAVPSVAMTREQAKKINEARGYLDIDPENCWLEWQHARVAAKKAPTPSPKPTAPSGHDSA